MMSAEEIVDRAFHNLYGFSSVYAVEISSPGGIPIRAIGARQAGPLDKLLTRFSDRNGLLQIETAPYEYQTRVYVAALRKDRSYRWNPMDRVPGTGLVNEDLVPRRAGHWSAQLVEEGSFAGRSASLIEIRPRKAKFAYERALVWFDHQLPIILQSDFHGKRGAVQRATVDPALVVQVAGHYLPSQVVFSPRTTVVRVSQVQIGPQDDALFTVRALRKETLPRLSRP
jgi:hypothetical protein